MRTILFVLNENNMAEDLLFDSPNYPVLNLSDNDICLNADFTISQHIFKIGFPLKYLGFPEYLTIEDIIHLKRTYFSIDWVLDHSSLFGIYETGKEESGYQTLDSNGNNRSFNHQLDDGPIPKSFFYAFWYNRQYYYCHSDIFYPEKKEGMIRELKPPKTFR